MSKQQIIASIHSVLREKMQLVHLAVFCETARLNEELYLDSVLLLQLLLHLELDFGFSIPETALTDQRFSTVAGLADYLLQLSPNTSATEITAGSAT